MPEYASQNKWPRHKAVLFINHFLWTIAEDCGMQTVYRTIKGFRDAGYHCCLILPCNDPDTPKQLNYRGIELFNIFTPFLPRKVRCNYLSWGDLRTTRGRVVLTALWRLSMAVFVARACALGVRLAQRQRFVLLYGMGPFGIVPAFVLSRLLGIPNVSRMFGVKTTLSKKGRVWNMLKNHLAVLCLKLPASMMIVTRDGSWREDVRMGFGASRRRIKVWFNGVDREHLVGGGRDGELRRRLHIKRDDVVLGMVTRLVSYRGIKTGLVAVKRLVRTQPCVKLLLVGDGEDREYFVQLAQEFSLGGNVIFAGAVPHKEAGRYLALIDICMGVAPASNLSNFALESLVAGKCIVTFNTADIATVIEDGVNGALVPENDLDALVKRLDELISNPRRRELLGRAAGAWAKKNILTWQDRVNMEIDYMERHVIRWN